MHRYTKALVAVTLLALLASFRIEGHTQFIGTGPTEYYVTMARCEREAVSSFEGGGLRYAGYACTRKFLWFTLGKRQFANGKPTVSVD